MALALALLGAGPAAHAQQQQQPASPEQPVQPPAAAPVDLAEAGRKVYVFSCQRCHGVKLVSMGIGFDLRKFPQDDQARFVRSVSNGTDRGMPAWGKLLKPGQLDQLWAYIGSINGWNLASGTAADAAAAPAPASSPPQ